MDWMMCKNISKIYSYVLGYKERIAVECSDENAFLVAVYDTGPHSLIIKRTFMLYSGMGFGDDTRAVHYSDDFNNSLFDALVSPKAWNKLNRGDK